MSLAGRQRGAIRWESDTLTPTLGRLTVVIYAETNRIVHKAAERVEKYMKENAPWEDRTGAARDGLEAIPRAGIDEFTIYLRHTVSYGIWLEVRWNGLYAIIEPTLDQFGPEVMNMFEGLLVRSAVIARSL